MASNWSMMNGAYGVPFDPRPAIDRLARNRDDMEAWDALWEDLHHQGRLGDASLAAVPLLVAAFENQPRVWNFYALVGAIESERHRRENASLSADTNSVYLEAVMVAKTYALEDLVDPGDKFLAVAALALVALTSGLRKLGTLLSQLDESEVDEVSENRLAWSAVYGD